MPNLFVLFVLFLGLYGGKKIGIILGVIFGLILDICTSKSIGVSAIMLGLIGFLGGYFDKNFSKESRITIMIMVIGSTLIYEIGYYIINSIILQAPIDMLSFIKIVIAEIVFNTILTIII